MLEQYLAAHWGIQLGASQPTAITLSTRGYKLKGVARADLTWAGASGATADVYRNNALIVSTPNDGSHTDVIGKVNGTFIYKVCSTGTTTCSATSQVAF